MEAVKREIKRNLDRLGHDSGRLFHGRGNCFSGYEHLNIDYYQPVVVIQQFAEDQQAVSLPTLLSSVFSDEDDLCWLLQERHLPKAPWTLLRGSLPVQNFARENGLIFELSFMKNQNTGFFPDMREGRELTARLAAGGKVLNLFSYTCSFSVVAMAAGASAVLNMDMSKSALRVGKKNHRRNCLDSPNVRYLPHDVLKSFGRMKRLGPFSLVIIDPPTHQKGAFEAEKDYARIIRRLPEMLEPGAHVLACLNTPWLSWQFLSDLFADSCWQEEGRCQRPPEYPEKDPEQSLKILHLSYRPVS